MRKLIASVAGLFFVGSVAVATFTQKGAGGITTSRADCTVSYNSGITNNTTIGAKCWRVGDTLHIEGQLRFSGAGGAGAVFRVQLPSGYVIDTAKLTNGTATGSGEASAVGGCRQWDDADVGYRTVCAIFYDTGGTQNQVAFEIGGGSLLDNQFAANDSFEYKIEAPIVGW